MIINRSYELSQEIYSSCLKKVGDIGFTPREIDIIACMISGRSAKKAAAFLSLSPKTVESYTHNIMVKLECNSREAIIDFVEQSDQFQDVKRYYTSLLIQDYFEHQLQQIAIVTSNKKPTTLRICWQENEEHHVLIQHLKKHLKNAGANVFLEILTREETFSQIFHENYKEDYVIYAVESLFPDKELPRDSGMDDPKPGQSQLQITSPPSNAIFLILGDNNEENCKNFSVLNYIDFHKKKNYYFSFFQVLKRLFPDIIFEKYIDDFEKKHRTLGYISTSMSSQTHSIIEKSSLKKVGSTLIDTFYKSKGRLIASSLLIAGLLYFCLKIVAPDNIEAGKRPDVRVIGADLPTPALLDRFKLIQEIDQKLTGLNGIQTIALVGIGGAGKTTLARQYTLSQKQSIVWEMNAETKESIINSFEALAYALCQTDEEKKTLNILKDIRNSSEKNNRIMQIVKEQLKSRQNWLLIYDNVESFKDLQPYIPSDPNVWGKGKIVITTQDTHIQNNGYVNDTVWIGELDPNEKLSLFMRIMNPGNTKPVDITHLNATKKFLEKIPPFPLDITVAAHYIQATNVDRDRYLKYLVNYSQDFSTLQETVLKGLSNYTKTRYQIITMSSEKLIETNKAFRDLLLLTCLLDSNQIPRDLLDSYRGRLTVDSFIYNLKKYSLIIQPLQQPTVTLTHIFIHPSTQGICLAYLADFFKLNKESLLLKEIVCVLDDYIDKTIEEEDIPTMQIMAEHFEKLLSHPNLLTPFSKNLISSKLGCIYYFLNNNKSALLIKESLKGLMAENSRNLSSEDQFRLARSLLHIGAICIELRLYEEAQESLERAASFYGKGGLDNTVELSWTLSHLGNLYRRVGNYEKAKGYLEESLNLGKQYGDSSRRRIRTLSTLGSVYRGLGAYQKSINFLEESLALCNKHYPKDHFRIGRILRSLGNVYRRLGDYKQAEQYFEDSLIIYKKYFPEDHINIGLALAYLGNCLRELGDYEQSRDYLEQSLKIHHKHYGDKHARTGWILFHIASTYKALGKHQESQDLFDKVLKIYDKDHSGDNIETARLLRDIAVIYLEKNLLDESESFAKRSLNTLKDRNHVDAYRSLEVLGEIYCKKYTQLRHTKNSQESQIYKNQAIDQFKQALKIAEQYFPKNSAHIERISSKIKSLQEGML